MPRARSRTPASFSDSDEEDESESFSDSEEEDESESYSDSSTTSTKGCAACAASKKSEEIAELKQKLSVCENYQREMDKMLRHQIGMNGSMMEILNGVNLQFKKNDEMFKQTRKKLKRTRKKFKRNQEVQESMMKMIEEIKLVVMMAVIPPEHLRLQQQQQQQQQQQPPQPAAAAIPQPQPKHRRKPRGG